MTKYTDLQDSLSAGLARDENSHSKARRFCQAFTSSLADYLGTAEEHVIFVKREIQVDNDSGRIVPPDDPIEHESGKMVATLVFRVDNTDVFVPFSMVHDPLADAIMVTVGKHQPQEFDVRNGAAKICDRIHELAITRFSSGLRIDPVVTL